MKNLTNIQKEFILNIFFKNDKYYGWEHIATELLSNGRCIVAGNDCIWKGGIGNFIKTKQAKNAVDCLLYEFDIDTFLKSSYYLEVEYLHLDALFEKIKDIKNEYLGISKLRQN